MDWGIYIAVARSKEDNSIVSAVDFNTFEDALNYIEKEKEVNPDDSIDLKLEKCTYEHYAFWYRDRN